MDMMFPYDFDTSGPDNFGAGSYNVCSAHGFVYQLDVDSWRGSAAPPSANNVETRTTVRIVDDYGRALSVFYQNDLYRGDDDLCVDTQYATPTGTDDRVLTAPSSRQLSDCSAEHVYSVERWEYDLLPGGSVSAGFVTGHTTDRHATDTGALLGTIRDYDISYDAQGNPTQVLTVREDGAARTETIDYDQFGLVPVHRATNATNAPTLEVFLTYDPTTLALVSARDENGTVQSTVFDGFVRPVLAEITPAGGTLGVTAQRTYTGFGVGSTGRSVFTTAFPDPVDPATLATAVGHSTITYLDELGRERVSKLLLGSDYTGTMVIGDRTYDGLGRVVFEADPYPSAQAPSTAYGTTRFFNYDGSPRVFIRGRGQQAFTTVPDDPTERYPTLFTHTFDSHTESMSVQDAASLTSGTPQNGVVQAGIASAIGRVLFRSTWQNGTRLEHEAFSYDRLGQLASMIRYQDAAGGTNPVQWSWQYDSLGQVLGLSEPSNAPQTRTYSNWGELVQVQWTPASPEPTHTLLRTYDALSRLTHAEEQNGGVVDASTLKNFDYDVGRTATPLVDPTFVLGRLAHAAAPTGEMFFSYDAFGRVSARSYTDETATVYVEQHTFHGDGSEATMELDLPDNNYRPERVTYGYDSAGRQRSMLFSDGTSTQTLYQSNTVDPFGRLRQASFANSNYVANYADIGRRLPTDVTVSSSKGTRNVVFNRFDAMAREVSRTEQTPTGGTLSVSYDALGRLSTSLKTNGPNTVAHWGFSYDPLGNVLALNDVIGTTGATLSYLATDQDRICRAGFGPGGLGGTTCNFGYDSFGNITREPTRTGFRNITYLNSGNVSSISDSSGATAAFRYDAFGDLQELDIVNGGDKRTDRLYGEFITSRYQKVGNKKSNFIARQFPGPDINISRHGPSGPWIFEFGEGRGNRFNTDQTGAFVQDLDYQPFGEATSSGAQPGTVGYSTEQWNNGDALTTFGLVRLGARLYDPVIGRFLSRDPLLVPRTAATSNPYAFAMNDPHNGSDPSGLDPDPWGNTSITTSSSGDDNGGAILAGVLGALIGGYDYYSHQRDRPSITPPMSTQRQIDTFVNHYNDNYNYLADRDYLAQHDPPVESEGLLIDQLPLVLIRGTLQGACDFIACDQETGGGDHFVDDGHGGVVPDSHVPHRVSYTQQAFNVGTNVLAAKVAGSLSEGRVAGEGGACPGGICGGDTCFTAGTPVATDSGSTPIETLRPGDRVHSLDRALCTATIDLGSCRTVAVEMEESNGRAHPLAPTFLRSQQWIDDHAIEVGAEFPLQIRELGINGSAHVTGIGMCTIAPGTGCVVTGTITHASGPVLRLHFAESAETLEPTATHPLWSIDRGDWVRAGELDVGERLRTETGWVTVSAIEHVEGAPQVFNLEVAGAHTYLVSNLEIESHNGGCGPGPIRSRELTTMQDFKNRSVVGDNLEGHELWQHANLREQGLATSRLSTSASRENPVIALDQGVHQRVTAAQSAFDAATQTPMQNIAANAKILRDLNAAAPRTINRLVKMARKHARDYGF